MAKSSTTTRKTPAKAGSAKASTVKTQAAQASSDDVPTLKKRELFERVKARAEGVKGKDVRVVMDAMLEELGLMLVEGKGLNARPLGTLKVQKHRTQPGADVVVCKLRRKKPGAARKEPLADAAE